MRGRLEKTVLYSEEIKEYKIEKLNALPRDHYFPAKPATHEPEQWNNSKEILYVQASVSNKSSYHGYEYIYEN